jgi:chromosome segregation ATPase
MPTKKPSLKSDPPAQQPAQQQPAQQQSAQQQSAQQQPMNAPVAPEPAQPQDLGRLHSELAAARQAASSLAAELAQREGELAALRAQLRRLHDDSLDRELDMTTLLRQEIAKRDKQYSKVLGSLSFRLGMSATAPMRWLFDKIAGSSKPAE